jgi:signal transduction histidine kinase
MKRLGRRGFLLIVGGSLLVPTLLLCLLGLKLLRDFTEITRDFRSEYGEYMARIAAASVEDALWEQEQLNMVSARLDPPKNPQEVTVFLDRLRGENPHYLLAFFVVPEGLVHYSQADLERTQAFRPLPAWILDPVLELLQEAPRRPSGLRPLSAPDSLPPQQVTYFNVHDENGVLLGAAGFVWNLEVVKRKSGIFERVLEKQLRADPDIFRGAIFRSPVTVTLLDESAAPFYATSENRTRLIARRHFSRLLTFYEVGVHLSEDRFDTWVGSVVRTNLALIAVMFLAIVAAVIFSLRFVLHEMELAELKSTLVSNVSHELKTPLALIRLFSETLELGRAPGKEKEKEFLRIIHKESERLTHLIDNVLDLNRIEQGRKTYTMRPTDLAAVVSETLDAYRFQLQQQGFTLASRIAEDLPPVAADGDALTQALLNLIDNAIKYSSDKKSLRVDLERRDGEAVISVEDQGIGIHPREHDKIFDMFYRVERGLVHSVKGSGLGLSLVKHIVNAHGGRITLDSRPGHGSRFSIALPLHYADSVDANPEPGEESSP